MPEFHSEQLSPRRLAPLADRVAPPPELSERSGKQQPQRVIATIARPLQRGAHDIVFAIKLRNRCTRTTRS